MKDEDTMPSTPLPDSRTETTLAPELEARFAELAAELGAVQDKLDRLLSLAVAYADEQQDARGRLSAHDESLANLSARVARLEPIPPPPPNGPDRR